jgi:hypothetical protein
VSGEKEKKLLEEVYKTTEGNMTAIGEWFEMSGAPMQSVDNNTLFNAAFTAALEFAVTGTMALNIASIGAALATGGYGAAVWSALKLYNTASIYRNQGSKQALSGIVFADLLGAVGGLVANPVSRAVNWFMGTRFGAAVGANVALGAANTAYNTLSSFGESETGKEIMRVAASSESAVRGALQKSGVLTQSILDATGRLTDPQREVRQNTQEQGTVGQGVPMPPHGDRDMCSSRSRFLEGELRPFLPIAGDEVFLLDPGENLRKKVSLALWEKTRGQNPNGDIYNNRLLRQNQYNWNLRMHGDLYDTPPKFGHGHGLNQGIHAYGQWDPRVFKTPEFAAKLNQKLLPLTTQSKWHIKDLKWAKDLMKETWKQQAAREFRNLQAHDLTTVAVNPTSLGAHHPQEHMNESNHLAGVPVTMDPPRHYHYTRELLPPPVWEPVKSRVNALGSLQLGPVNATSLMVKPPQIWQNLATNPQLEPVDNLDWDKHTLDLWNVGRDPSRKRKTAMALHSVPNTQLYDSHLAPVPQKKRRIYKPFKRDNQFSRFSNQNCRDY